VPLKQLVYPKIFIKATLLFFSANILNLSLHELTHAVTAWLLKVPATLFHLYVDINQNRATTSDQVIIALAGPVFSLFAGVLCWTLYKKSATATGRLFLFYAAMLGISIFFGNLFSTAFAGDFHKLTQLLDLSQSWKVFISALGLAGLISFLFISGREFFNIGLFEMTERKSAILNGLFIPWLLGTILQILAYAPLPSNFVMGIISSSVFWIFSIIGAATGKPVSRSTHFSKVSLSITDIALFIISVLLVRILVAGIHLSP